MYSSCINSAYFTTRKKIWEEGDAGAETDMESDSPRRRG